MSNADQTETAGEWGQTYWRSLYYFNLYRLFLGVAFVAIGFSGGSFATLGSRSPGLFLAASVALVLIAVVSLITITKGSPGFRLQAQLQFGLDVVLITLLGSASGGITSGLHLLLLVSVAAGGVVLPGRMSLFFAAFGTVLALVEHGASQLVFPVGQGSYTQVGILGIALFTTSMIINFVARRLQQAEAIAERSMTDLVDSSKLNEMVVARLDIGILVVDQQGVVRLSNARARALIGIQQATDRDPPLRLRQSSPQIDQRLQQWRRGEPPGDPIQPVTNGPKVALRFASVSDRNDADVVIFLEDVYQAEQRAQQLKLAALGRLTGAVAHEIRNPLAAISHAGQLMNESQGLSTGDKRLVSIVNQQSGRINQIIKSLLRLGHPALRASTLIDLDSWLERFSSTFCDTHRCAPGFLTLSPTGLKVYMDPDHLNQVLTNLCENALRHGSVNGKPARVFLSGGRLPESSAPFLDVANDGPAIPVDIQDKIFEPFFTTGGKGTGLGLYLSRELCQDNNARLDYVTSPRGNLFRIQFNRVSNVVN